MAELQAAVNEQQNFSEWLAQLQQGIAPLTVTCLMQIKDARATTEAQQSSQTQQAKDISASEQNLYR